VIQLNRLHDCAYPLYFFHTTIIAITFYIVLFFLSIEMETKQNEMMCLHHNINPTHLCTSCVSIVFVLANITTPKKCSVKILFKKHT